MSPNLAPLPFCSRFQLTLCLYFGEKKFNNWSLSGFVCSCFIYFWLVNHLFFIIFMLPLIFFIYLYFPALKCSHIQSSRKQKLWTHDSFLTKHNWMESRPFYFLLLETYFNFWHTALIIFVKLSCVYVKAFREILDKTKTDKNSADCFLSGDTPLFPNQHF